MDIIHPQVEVYTATYTSPETELLKQINLTTKQTHALSHMLSGPVQGKFLSFISTILQPVYILEIGTFTGYSAICMVEGLQPQGELHTIELREADAATARENFSKSDRNNQIHLHTGNALEIIPNLDKSWDLVFIDADKTAYIDYYELVVPRLAAGGIILADNVLFHGEVLQTPVTSKNAKAIQAFNEHVMKDERTEQVMVTIRDGVLMIKKKA